MWPVDRAARMAVSAATAAATLVAHGGFDSKATRLHMATSADGHAWTPQGTIMQQGAEDALAAATRAW
jgi:hypothetical protein